MAEPTSPPLPSPLRGSSLSPGGERAQLHVAVLMGGWSAEREVSLTSGKGVVDALESLGHRVTPVDMDRNVAQILAGIRPDVVFNALHGRYGDASEQTG